MIYELKASPPTITAGTTRFSLTGLRLEDVRCVSLVGGIFVAARTTDSDTIELAGTIVDIVHVNETMVFYGFVAFSSTQQECGDN